jgi:hypothetical protein
VAKSLELKSALIRFCEVSRGFNFGTVTERDYPLKAVVEWKKLRIVADEYAVNRGSSSEDPAAAALAAETQQLVRSRR